MYKQITNKLKPGIALLLFSVSATICMAQQKENVFSLKECINYTLQTNLNGTVYKNNSIAAEEKIKQSKAAFLPTVSANGSVDYNIKLQTSIIPAGSLNPTETKLQIGNKVSSGVYIQADQAIFDKSSSLNIKSSKLNKEISDLNIKQENDQLIYNTATAYYDVLAYKEKGKLLKTRKEQYQQLCDIAKIKFEQGVQKKSELDKASVNLNNTKAEIDLNETNYQLSLNKLKYAMGMDLPASLEIRDSVDNISLPVSINIAGISGFDTTSYTAYLIDKKNTEAKQLEIEKKKAAFLPTISAYSKYGGNSYGSQFSNAYNSIYDYSAVGVKVSVPLFSGFKKSSELKQSKIEAENQKLTQKLNANTYNLNVKNEESKLFSSYTSVIKNRQNLDLAKEVINASLVDYKTGNSNLSSFLNDDYSYKEAQNNYITSLIDFFNSQLSFEKAKGTLTSYLNNLK